MYTCLLFKKKEIHLSASQFKSERLLVFSEQLSMWKRTSLSTISYKMTYWTTLQGVWSSSPEEKSKCDLPRGIQRKGYFCSKDDRPISRAQQSEKASFLSNRCHTSHRNRFFLHITELQTTYGKCVHLVCCSRSLLLYLMDLFVFHLFSAFQLTLTSFPPPWKPHLSSAPSPVSSPPSPWVWLSSLYRGRWGHKTAGEARGGPRDKVCTWLIITLISQEHLCKPRTRARNAAVVNLCSVVAVCVRLLSSNMSDPCWASCSFSCTHNSSCHLQGQVLVHLSAPLTQMPSM